MAYLAAMAGIFRRRHPCQRGMPMGFAQPFARRRLSPTGSLCPSRSCRPGWATPPGRLMFTDSGDLMTVIVSANRALMRDAARLFETVTAYAGKFRPFEPEGVVDDPDGGHGWARQRGRYLPHSNALNGARRHDHRLSPCRHGTGHSESRSQRGACGLHHE